HHSGWPHAHTNDRWVGGCAGRCRPRCAVSQPPARDLCMEDSHRGSVHDLGLATLRMDRARRELHGSIGALLSHRHESREGRIIMLMLPWSFIRLVVMTLALLGATALPARSEVVSSGPKVGQWKTWVLTSSTEISVLAPLAEISDQAKAALAELRQLQ